MNYVICGGSGFIGRALTDKWLADGHRLLLVGRKLPDSAHTDPRVQYATWDSLASDPHPAEGCDALVNLAGATLNQHWSASGKTSIHSSRLDTVAAAAKLVQSLSRKPSVVIQASAVGIYGTSADQTFDEASPARVMDFPSEVVKEWEDAAEREYTGVRVVKLRTGVVLGNGGGAFRTMKLPYVFGVGGRIGSGRQWISWIHIDDVVSIIDFCVNTPAISGPVNATAPAPVTNDEFGRTVGKVYGRPHWLPLPAFVLRLLLGELSQLVLEGQRVLPSKLTEHGFVFAYPTLEQALRQLKSNP